MMVMASSSSKPSASGTSTRFIPPHQFALAGLEEVDCRADLRVTLARISAPAAITSGSGSGTSGSMPRSCIDTPDGVK